MKHTDWVVAAVVAVMGGPAIAALAPRYQNANDLDVLVAFVKKHQRVASTLKVIDLQKYTIHFDADCKAEFERQKIERPSGWAGPAAPLVFVRSSCSLE